MAETSEPFAEVTIGKEKVAVTRENLILFRHLGTNAVYDHCYIVKPNGGGGYIWKHQQIFERYAKLAEQHQARMILNKPAPDTTDVEAYMQHVTEDLATTATVPEAWL